MSIVGKIASGVGEVAGFERAQTYDLKMIVKARNPREAENRAKDILKQNEMPRGNFGPGGMRRMFTQYVAWGYANEVDGYAGFTLTHKKSLKVWKKELRSSGHPSSIPMPFESAGQPDFIDAGITEENIYDGTAWLVNAWLGRQYPHAGPLSL